MPTEPVTKRAIAFIDGQNLFRCAKSTYGYHFPNYDVHALASAVCQREGWQLSEIRFYTGVPDSGDDPVWSHFWAGKLLQMSRQGIVTFSRPLRYRNKIFQLQDGSRHTVLVGQEKGIDVRLAIDIVAAAYHQRAEVILVFSQDQDLSEVADEVRAIARDQKRWLKIASAFPSSPTSTNRRGINSTDWIRLDRALYDSCIDPRDYRPQPPPAP